MKPIQRSPTGMLSFPEYAIVNFLLPNYQKTTVTLPELR